MEGEFFGNGQREMAQREEKLSRSIARVEDCFLGLERACGSPISLDPRLSRLGCLANGPSAEPSSNVGWTMSSCVSTRKRSSIEKGLRACFFGVSPDTTNPTAAAFRSRGDSNAPFSKALAGSQEPSSSGFAKPRVRQVQARTRQRYKPS